MSEWIIYRYLKLRQYAVGREPQIPFFVRVVGFFHLFKSLNDCLCVGTVEANKRFSFLW